MLLDSWQMLVNCIGKGFGKYVCLCVSVPVDCDPTSRLYLPITRAVFMFTDLWHLCPDTNENTLQFYRTAFLGSHYKWIALNTLVVRVADSSGEQKLVLLAAACHRR